MSNDLEWIESTRDPIYLLQERTIYLAEAPDGFEYDDGWYVVDDELVDDWIRPFIDCHGFIDMSEEFWDAAREEEGFGGCAMVVEKWNTVSVWLDREEAEANAQAETLRTLRVDCVPCSGELAKLISEYRGSDVPIRRGTQAETAGTEEA